MIKTNKQSELNEFLSKQKTDKSFDDSSVMHLNKKDKESPNKTTLFPDQDQVIPLNQQKQYFNTAKDGGFFQKTSELNVQEQKVLDVSDLQSSNNE